MYEGKIRLLVVIVFGWGVVSRHQALGMMSLELQPDNTIFTL
jgi:hypothetical protein